ncbi:NAD-dependent epimerase/dehydratase family protein [Streptomyces sulphureus]|uniref:NAD-dependent epimerase/dehydratase family protein n=1 Tax=Streptomyces sulphureus TaxID=47758 RepID=UPI00037AAD40|nr:NAD(P)-dependent oxidoreductase [Streptomyces sulphureus]
MTAVLVTGAAGTLGRAVLGTWSAAPSHPPLVALDRRPPPELPGVHSLTAESDGPFSAADRALLDGVTHLVHLAGTVTTGTAPADGRWASLLDEPRTLTRLLEVLPALRHTTFASSYMVYAAPRRGPLTERHEKRACNAYAWSKSATELLLEGSGVPGCSLRFTGVYGPGVPLSTGRLLMLVLEAALSGSPLRLSGPDSRRNHLYIDDAVTALRRACEEEWAGSFNIGGPAGISTREVVDTVASLTGTPLDVTWEPGAPGWDAAVDTSAVRERYGFQARTPMREGLDAYRAWLLDAPAAGGGAA